MSFIACHARCVETEITHMRAITVIRFHGIFFVDVKHVYGSSHMGFVLYWFGFSDAIAIFDDEITG